MLIMSEKSRIGERDHKKHLEHPFELFRRNNSSLNRNLAPVIVLEYVSTRRGYCREAIIKRGGTTEAIALVLW